MIEGGRAERLLKRLSPHLSGTQWHAIGASLGLRIWAMALGFVTTLLLAHMLGAAAFGAYAFAFGWINILLLATTFGFHHFNVREIARLAVHGQSSEIAGLAAFSNAIGFVVSLTVSFAAPFVSTIVPLSPDPAMERAFVVGVWLLPLLTLSNIRQGFMRGLGRPVVGQAPELGLFPLLLLMLLGAVFVTSATISAEHALVLNIVAAAIAFLVGALNMITEMRRRRLFEGLGLLPGLWVRGAGYSLIIGAASVINSSADLVMLGAMTDAEQTGAYGLAVRIVALLLVPMLAVAAGLSHEISTLHNSGRTHALENLVRAAGRQVVGATALLTVGVTAMTPFFGWLFGAEFVASIAPLLILAWARFLETLAGQPGMVLVNTSHAGLGAVCVSISAAANVALNLLLIPTYGTVGAASATAISQLALVAVMAWLVSRRVGLSTLPFAPRHRTDKMGSVQ